MLKRIARRVAAAALVLFAFTAGMVVLGVYALISFAAWAIWGAVPPVYTFVLAFVIPPLAVGALTGLGIGAQKTSRALRRKRTARAEAQARTGSWEAACRRRDSSLVAWSRYETDVALLIDYPVMTDYSDPVIREVLVAMQGIREAERGSDPARLHLAVDRFEVALRTAENYARRCGQSKLTDQERSKLATARTALNLILDGAAAPSEVDGAYRSLRGALRGIIDLPAPAAADLEAHARQARMLATPSVKV
ncbi:hypothetical protein H9639_15090 [Arthrobacter sp. Sa2CUA1]|uniref:Uncharacterized protein n=1 Tax=Arthrobacter gallicola TaxID=2762225 RepID=A0ABR8UVQ7_9MICC|nr:hypothetical protein [Arthrobacter gallicola]MBD7996622.1 hypothetical protein [Arthrobacter gallicola]